MSQKISLAVISGDGIGPEVVEQGLAVLQTVTSGIADIETTDYDWGARRWKATGEILSDEDIAQIRQHDAILLGAIGDPDVPSGLLERGLLLKLRFSLDHFINLRPTKLFPGVASPLAQASDIDFLVYREGTEGPYVGNGGALRVGTPAEIATEVSVNTALGVERVVRAAFAKAATRPARKVTLIHKHNVLVHAGGLWQRIVNTVGEEYPEVSVDYLHIDAATIFMVTDPARFDVIVTDNLFGDIITDLAAAVSGGIGLAASGNINTDLNVPSMFEPVHGSAPDIAGQGKADPTATILSVALMLDHLGMSEQSQRIETAVGQDLAERGNAVRSTTEIGSDIIARLR